MFTGIIQAIGRVVRIGHAEGDARLLVEPGNLDTSEQRLGDSMAVSGCCLTLVEQGAAGLAFDVSAETLACTTLGNLAAGDQVNLEPALRLADRLDGHLVSGHVDGVGTVREVVDEARSKRFAIEAPEALARFIAGKGSVAVDGVSLTVNRVDGARFELNLIPHTMAHTTFGRLGVGSAVNIEVDLIARYTARLLDSH